MNQKKFFYLAGLPRTGSTVLGEILNQNPNMHVSPASSLCEIVGDVIHKWKKDFVTLKAYQHPDQLKNVWNGIRNGMYQHRNETVICDKSWVWQMDDPINSTRKYLDEEMKVICPVDDVTDCLASFIMLIRSNPDYTSFIDEHLQSQNIPLTDANRCEALMNPKMPSSIGWCLENLKQTYRGKNRGNLLLVERGSFVKEPQTELKRIYNFIGCEDIEAWDEGKTHVFDTIEKEIIENDGIAYGIPNLHKITAKLRGRTWSAKEVLGNKLFFKYKRMEFWRPSSKKK